MAATKKTARINWDRYQRYQAQIRDAQQRFADARQSINGNVELSQESKQRRITEAKAARDKALDDALSGIRSVVSEDAK